MKIWLASASPRRRTLLAWLGHELDVHPADVDETREPGEDPVAYAERLALTKAATAPADVVAVAADTVVHLDGDVLDKPVDRAEVARHLARLSGRWHAVTTGWCARSGDRVAHGSVTTEVRFRALSDAEIARYAATGEGDDKAGAYAIQGAGGVLVAEVRGSWTGVMGLPVEEVLGALASLGGPR